LYLKYLGIILRCLLNIPSINPDFKLTCHAQNHLTCVKISISADLNIFISFYVPVCSYKIILEFIFFISYFINHVIKSIKEITICDINIIGSESILVDIKKNTAIIIIFSYISSL